MSKKEVAKRGLGTVGELAIVALKTLREYLKRLHTKDKEVNEGMSIAWRVQCRKLEEKARKLDEANIFPPDEKMNCSPGIRKKIIDLIVTQRKDPMSNTRLKSSLDMILKGAEADQAIQISYWCFKLMKYAKGQTPEIIAKACANLIGAGWKSVK